MLIDQQYTADREKLQKIRLLMVGQVELMGLLSRLLKRFFILTLLFTLLPPTGSEEPRDCHPAEKD